MTIIKKADMGILIKLLIVFGNYWKCSKENWLLFEGSKWQWLDGSVNTRSGHFHTGRRPAGRGGAHHQRGLGSLRLGSIQTRLDNLPLLNRLTLKFQFALVGGGLNGQMTATVAPEV